MPKVLLSDQTVEFALRGPVLFAPGAIARSGSIVSQLRRRPRGAIARCWRNLAFRGSGAFGRTVGWWELEDRAEGAPLPLNRSHPNGSRERTRTKPPRGSLERLLNGRQLHLFRSCGKRVGNGPNILSLQTVEDCLNRGCSNIESSATFTAWNQQACVYSIL